MGRPHMLKQGHDDRRRRMAFDGSDNRNWKRTCCQLFQCCVRSHHDHESRVPRGASSGKRIVLVISLPEFP